MGERERGRGGGGGESCEVARAVAGLARHCDPPLVTTVPRTISM